MHLTVASLTLSATRIVWIWACAAHRRPEPLAWTRYDAASIAVLLVLTGTPPLGIGLLAAALISPLETLHHLDLAGAVLALGTPLLAGLATPRLLVPMRQAPKHPAPGTVPERRDGPVGVKAKV